MNDTSGQTGKPATSEVRQRKKTSVGKKLSDPVKVKQLDDIATRIIGCEPDATPEGVLRLAAASFMVRLHGLQLLAIGTFLLNSYICWELIHQTAILKQIWMYGTLPDSGSSDKGDLQDLARRPMKVWVVDNNLEGSNLINVVEVFQKIGFQVVSGNQSDQDWDVLWSHPYPFTKPATAKSVKDLKPWQRVNHFPGSGFITNKVNLIKSGGVYSDPELRARIPLAFRLPAERAEFLVHQATHPMKMWVQKSAQHRGVRIKRKFSETDLSSNGTFIQEFIANPLLIDGKKFDIGIYVILTGVDPLRLYVFQDVNLRFCIDDYYKTMKSKSEISVNTGRFFDTSNLKSYVVADEFLPVWQIPSLKKMFKNHNLSRKQTLNAYLTSQGHDNGKLWRDIEDAIRRIYIDKEELFIQFGKKYPSSQHFFELVRFDFLVDDQLQPWLLEANMSPSMSHYAPNKQLYQQVLFNLFSLLGFTQRNSTSDAIKVADQDLSIVGGGPSQYCISQDCDECDDQKKCAACWHCLADDMKDVLREAYHENFNRWNTKRLLPDLTTGPSDESGSVARGDRNAVLLQWFRGKCLEDKSFC